MRTLFLMFFSLLLLSANDAAAISLTDIPRQSEVPDFVIFPARQEIQLEAGDASVKQLSIINRLGHEAVFTLSVQDFSSGSDDLSSPVSLLGDELGPYSLKNYISLSRREIILPPGAVATIDVGISLPPSAPPSGLYGAVVVTAKNMADQSNAQLSSSAASLFFVKVEGDVREAGRLSAFGVGGDRLRFNSQPLNLNMSYVNEGNIYVNPYGRITVTNILGQTVDTLIIDPWFVLPGSERIREVSWDPGYRFGWYRAKLELNRGYDDIVDESNLNIFLAPWPILLGLLAIVIGIFLYRHVLKLKK